MRKILELTLILSTLSVTATFTAFSHPHPGGTPAGFDGVKQIRSSDGGGHFHQAFRNKPGTADDPDANNELEKVIGSYSEPLGGDSPDDSDDGGGPDDSDDGGGPDDSDDGGGPDDSDDGGGPDTSDDGGGPDTSDDGGPDDSDDGGGPDTSDDGGPDDSDDGGGPDDSDDGGPDTSDDGGTVNSDVDSTADAEGEGSPPISTTRDIPHSHNKPEAPHSHNKPEAVVAGIHFGYIHTHHGFKHVHSLFYGDTEAILKFGQYYELR